MDEVKEQKKINISDNQNIVSMREAIRDAMSEEMKKNDKFWKMFRMNKPNL